MDDSQLRTSAEVRIEDNAELAVLDAMRDNDVTQFIVIKKRDNEIILETEHELSKSIDLNTAVDSHNFQTITIKRHEGRNVRISRTMPKRISRRKWNGSEQLNNE